METLDWKERINEFKEVEHYCFIELPTWCRNNKIKIIIDNGIFSNVYRSRFSVNGGGIRIVHEQEDIKCLEQVKEITITRLKELFNI